VGGRSRSDPLLPHGDGAAGPPLSPEVAPLSPSTPQSDPLALFQDLVLLLTRTVPTGIQYTPERLGQFAENALACRLRYTESVELLLREVRRWLRDGLDDSSFAEARKELDAAATQAAALAAADGTVEAVEVMHVRPDGTAIPLVMVSSHTLDRLSPQRDQLLHSVERLQRWRDCRKSKPDPSGRLSVDLDRQTLTLDGIQFTVQSVRALRWVRVLAEHPGNWVSSKDLEESDQDLINVRTDKLRKYLPEAVLSLIDSDTGKGSRIRLA
jgi:hypothetical protein